MRPRDLVCWLAVGVMAGLVTAVPVSIFAQNPKTAPKSEIGAGGSVQRQQLHRLA